MPSTDEVAVLAAEEARYRAMLDGHLDALERCCADELSYSHSSAVRDTEDEYLAKVQSGCYRYHRIAHPVERVEVVGDTAIVVGRMTADLDVDEVPKTVDNLALAVWVRRDAEWRLLTYAPTRLPG